MTITLNGTTGVTTPGVTDTGALSVTGISTLGAMGSSVITSGTINAGGTNPFPASAGPANVDFTGIPSWVKRITVIFNAVSTSGTSITQIQLGDGTVKTSGYATNTTQFVDAGAVSSVVASSGFTCLTSNAAVYNLIGNIQICSIGSNTWVANGVLGMSASGRSSILAGAVTLTGTLDRVRITTVNGTDLFDAGSINILYE